MAQKDWPAGVIRKTPVIPTGPYQNGKASGVWTMDQVAYWVKQDLWPLAGNVQSFDNTRILIPVPAGTYQVNLILYNWATSTATSLGSLSQFYTASSNMCGVVIDPNKNMYVSGGGSTGNSAFNNFAYIPAGSNTVSVFRDYSGDYPEYGDYYSQLCWNPTASKVQFHRYPHSYDSTEAPPYLMQWSGTTITTVGSTTLYGWLQPDAELLRSFNTAGKPTNGTTMLAQAGSTKAADNNNTWTASSPYTSFSSVTNVAGNASRNSIAPVSTTQAVIAAFGGLYYYSGGSVSNISSIGGISSGSFRFVIPLANGAFAAFAGSNTVYAYSNASTTPTWTTNLSSLFTGRWIGYLIGNGSTMYVFSALTSSPNTAYITQIVFNLSTGTYTATDRTLGVNSGVTGYSITAWRYY